MIIQLKRKSKINDCTFGEILINNKFFCYTLEDKIREIKIPGQTAIPAGEYEIIINRSVRFKRLMPLLLNVPNFAGIRMHKRQFYN